MKNKQTRNCCWKRGVEVCILTEEWINNKEKFWSSARESWIFRLVKLLAIILLDVAVKEIGNHFSNLEDVLEDLFILFSQVLVRLQLSNDEIVENLKRVYKYTQDSGLFTILDLRPFTRG